MQRSHGRKEQGLAQDRRGAMLSSKAVELVIFFVIKSTFALANQNPWGWGAWFHTSQCLNLTFRGPPSLPEIKEKTLPQFPLESLA